MSLTPIVKFCVVRGQMTIWQRVEMSATFILFIYKIDEIYVDWYFIFKRLSIILYILVIVGEKNILIKPSD